MFYFTRALSLAQISAINMDAESGNHVEIMVFDRKTVAQVTEFASCESSV